MSDEEDQCLHKRNLMISFGFIFPASALACIPIGCNLCKILQLHNTLHCYEPQTRHNAHWRLVSIWIFLTSFHIQMRALGAKPWKIELSVCCHLKKKHSFPRRFTQFLEQRKKLGPFHLFCPTKSAIWYWNVDFTLKLSVGSWRRRSRSLRTAWSPPPPPTPPNSQQRHWCHRHGHLCRK